MDASLLYVLVFVRSYAPVHNFGMQHDVPSLLRQMMEKLPGNQTQLAERLTTRALNVPQPQVSRWINGQKPEVPAYERIVSVAQELGVLPVDPAPETHTVKVVGRIGAGAEILPEAEQVPPEGLFQIEIPFPVPDATLAFEIEGDSMWPRYDAGDVVLCWKEGTNATEIIGWEAAVRTQDGRRFLKRILQGSRARHYDLESYNAPVIRNVKLEWVSKVQLVVRSGEWKQLGRNVQKRIAKKMAAGR